MPPSPLEGLREIIARLRAPGGCPWDREQTHASLAPSLLEEVYETIDAIARADDPNLREELGDLLLHVVMQAQIAAERGAFDFDDVATGVAEKMVRRHPHVFGDEVGTQRVTDSGSVVSRWEEIKRQEKAAKAAKAAAPGEGDQAAAVADEPSRLDGLPKTLPALLRARKIQEKAAGVGFDWRAVGEVLAKVREEVDEVTAAMAAAPSEARTAAVADEIGDLLFSVVNLARWHKLDAELTMHRATDKFERRFRAVEVALRRRQQAWEATTPAELDALWEDAKRQE